MSTGGLYLCRFFNLTYVGQSGTETVVIALLCMEFYCVWSNKPSEGVTSSMAMYVQPLKNGGVVQFRASCRFYRMARIASCTELDSWDADSLSLTVVMPTV